MSEQETDILREIEADLQRQQLEAFWKKWGNAILSGVIVIVLATAGIEWWRTTQEQSEQKATSQMIDLTTDDTVDATKKIESIQSFLSRTDEKGVATLTQLRAAADLAQAGKTDQAISLYDSIVQDKKIEKAFRDLADLMSVQLLMDSKTKPDEATQLLSRLQPLLADDCVWRYSAKDFTAHILLRQKKTEEALRLFESLAQDPDVTESIGSRARDMVVYLTSKRPASQTEIGKKESKPAQESGTSSR